MGDLCRIPLFDGNLIAAGQRQVKRAGGCRHIERDIVRGGGQGQRVGADLVGHVAVGGDPVGAGHDGLHAALAHDLSGHGVADQGHVHPPLLQFPHGQASALEEGPRFVDVDLQVLARLLGRKQDGQSRPGTGGGQAPGVAVRQYAAAVGQQRGAVTAKGLTDVVVFLMQGPRVRQEGRPQGYRPLAPMPLGHRLQPLERPKQIHGRRAAGRQPSGDLLQPTPKIPLVTADPLQAEADPVGRRDPDRRRTADP